MSAIVLHRSPIPATAARLEVARCCPVGRHDRASASRTPGSHLRRAVELPPLPTNPTIASAPQSASFLPQSTIDAVLEYHLRPPLPSKLLRGYLLPLFELELSTAARLGGLSTTLTSNLASTRNPNRYRY